jgi:hypothetical protein
VLVGGFNNDRPVWIITSYKKSGIFKNYTNDEFILDYINNHPTTSSVQDKGKYTIIQDPWEPTYPKYRNFGLDPYYLSNGAEILLQWFDKSNPGVFISGTTYSTIDGEEIITKDYVIQKSFKILHPDSSVITLNKNNEFESTIMSKDYENVMDKFILDEIIEKWNTKIPNYGLTLCSPSNEKCSFIPFKSPLDGISKEEVPPIVVPNNEVPKERMNVILPTDVVKAKVDITSLKVYIGIIKENTTNNPDTQSDDYIYDENENDILSEYTEAEFEGLDEVELNLQEEISSGQEDSDSNLAPVGAPVNIRPVGSLDDLLKLAGDCARELGKNPRVKYSNLRQGYIKGIHGLCPQGTLAVLYALTGVKSLGVLRGNANSFSMNGSNRLPSSHFNNKTKVGREYFSNPNSWQTGDIIAVDYVGGKPYGHIQIWTGTKWVSDFTQNKLQVSNINWNSVALHRVNANGLEAIRKQTSTIT